jgi:hypothetical protein
MQSSQAELEAAAEAAEKAIAKAAAEAEAKAIARAEAAEAGADDDDDDEDEAVEVSLGTIRPSTHVCAVYVHLIGQCMTKLQQFKPACGHLKLSA